jgi:NADPH-dependent curcumin reductase CurA
MVKPEEARDGFEPLPVGSVIPNGIIVRILQSNNDKLHPDDLVTGMGPIQEYVSLNQEEASQFSPVLNPYNLDLKYFLGPLGMPGLTAYSGLYDIGKPKKGETIFISAAAGAVGQVVGQIALHEGLTVIGSVGSDEKARLLKDTLNFHAVVNYRNRDILSQLRKLAPNGIDSELSNRKH